MVMSAQERQRVADEEIKRERANPIDEPTITQTWIETKVETGQHAFRGFRNSCEMADKFYLNDYDVPAPDGGTIIRLGTARSVINTLVSHITPQFLDISVPPPGPRGQARAEMMEKFLTGAHHMLEQRTPTHRELVKHSGLYGVAWEKVEFAANEWADFPEIPEGDPDETYRQSIRDVLEKRSILWPIKTSAVNPQNLVWDMNNGTNPRWIIYQYEVDAQWVQAHFPDWGHYKEGYVQFCEVWTHSQVAYMADGHWAMQPRKHGYKKLPWVMYWPMTGLQTVNDAPENLYQGLLHPCFDMLTAQSQLASHYIDIVAKSAWPTLQFAGPMGITEEVQAQWDDTPGAKNVRPPNVDVEITPTPNPPSEIGVAKQFLDEAIESATVPSVARGQRPSGAASGYHTAVLAGIASLNFGAVKESMERGLQDKGELVLSIVENVISDKVTVFGKTEAGTLDASIKPRDINGHYVNIVRINSVSPEEQERRLNLWSNLWRAGYVDLDTALRKGGVANPLEVRAKLLEEGFMNSEQVQASLQQLAASRVPTISQILQAATMSGGGRLSDMQAQDMAQNILNTQGAQQLPNPGNYSSVNQPPRTNMNARAAQSTRPVIPGSIQEMNQAGAAIAGPRTGNVRVPAADISPGARG